MRGVWMKRRHRRYVPSPGWVETISFFASVSVRVVPSLTPTFKGFSMLRGPYDVNYYV